MIFLILVFLVCAWFMPIRLIIKRLVIICCIPLIWQYAFIHTKHPVLVMDAFNLALCVFVFLVVRRFIHKVRERYS